MAVEPDLHTQPKKHAMMHLLKDIRWMGNPRLYANWTDESLNKLLKMACRLCSQATLESSVLHSMQKLLRSERRKRKADDML